MVRMRTTKMPNLKVDWATIANIRTFIPSYHANEDVLFIRPDKPRPAVSLDCGGEAWLRIDPQNGEVVGLEIDDFEAIFLKKHPEIASVWHDAKPFCRQRRPQASTMSSKESFLQILLQLLQSCLRDMPQQAKLARV